MTAAPKPGRIRIIQDLRGVAALSVCCYHFFTRNGMFAIPVTTASLSNAAQFGWLGVQIFFVISGFILPYSLFQAGYQASPGNFFRFLWKRLSRLEPPYIISIVFVLAVMSSPHLLPWLGGKAPEVTSAQLLLHLGYLNSVFNKGWYINPVYWTLGIEFQYYLLIGLLFPLIAGRARWMRASGWAVLLALGFGDHVSALGHWLFLFMLGFALFQYRAGLIGRVELACAALVVTFCSVETLGKSITLVGLAGFAAMLLVRWSNRPLSRLGDLSYSFYLIHLPVGGLVFRLTQPWNGSLVSRLAIVAGAMVASLSVAYALWRWVEQPCQRYAGALRFNPKFAGDPVEPALVGMEQGEIQA